ncbi:MAG: cardiolipin synthase B [Gemmatimonadetes bacterium]|nr:MAG: cardiolipin synthase B [Gemmatimonadota bacterium]
MLLIWVVIGLLLLGALVFISVTQSVNAEAGRQDDVVSVPTIASQSDEFMRTFGSVSGHAAQQSNGVELYQNGAEIFPPMLEAIADAHDSVHFSTYVYEAGHVPDVFASAFADAAKRGVEVRLILDRHGSKKIPESLLQRMKAAGCKVCWFRRAQWYDWEKYNRRTHRRLLVIDGTIGFTGGVGIADEWDGAGDNPLHWRDSHVRVRGPAVAALQSAFVDNWNEATGELVLGARYFPELKRVGDTTVSIVQSNPANATSAAQRSVAAIIAAATRSLYITNAYFVPTPPFVKALRDAHSRGVEVKVVVAGPYHNKPAVRRASRHTWADLLAGAVEIHEHQLTMVHAKVIVADGSVTCVGSINFDPRSFALNAECGAVMLDDDIARAATAAFDHDLANSRRVTSADLDELTFFSRVVDAAAYWVRSQL